MSLRKRRNLLLLAVFHFIMLAAFLPGFLNPRRTILAEPLDDFFFTQDYSEVMGASREGGKGQVVHLDVRRSIASSAGSPKPS